MATRNWKERAVKIAAGKFIKFDVNNPSMVITFMGEPTEKEMESTFRKGEVYSVLNFPVEVDGEDKILTPAKGLLRLIIDEDNELDIMGRTFRVKMIGEGKSVSWSLREMPKPARQTAWSPKAAEEGIEPDVVEDENEPRMNVPRKSFKPTLPEEEEEEPVERPAPKRMETDAETSARVKKEYAELHPSEARVEPKVTRKPAKLAKPPEDGDSDKVIAAVAKAVKEVSSIEEMERAAAKINKPKRTRKQAQAEALLDDKEAGEEA